MKDKRYTLLIVPDEPGRVKRLKFGIGSLKVFGSIVAVVMLIFVAMTAVSVVSIQRLTELRELRRENQVQKEQLLIFSSRLDDLKQTLDRISEFDAKLRVITNAGDKPNGPIAGVGGPGIDEAGLPEEAAGNYLLQKIHRDVSELSQAARTEERSIQELSSIFQDKRSLLAATPSIWPTRGWVTSNFGSRTSPFTGEMSIHEGMDIASGYGTWVRSAADGIITFAGLKGGYGKVIIVDHGYGLSTRYGHLSEIRVRRGQRVRRGDHIGSVGSTGRSTGPHLHYEVRVDNMPVNPRRYILD